MTMIELEGLPRQSGIAVQGDTPFKDLPLISHIQGNLYMGGVISGYPLPKEFQYVVSLYPWEQFEYNDGIRGIVIFGLYDSNDGLDEVEDELGFLADSARRMSEFGPTLIHCQMGLNRSGLLTALVLMENGLTAKEAIKLIRERRNVACLCNQTFVEWLNDTT